MVNARPRRSRRAHDSIGSYLLVAAGAAVGGVLRAVVSHAVALAAGSGFPWGTLTVNVIGSFLIGFYATLTAPDGRVFVSASQRQFVMAGILGGFTTFSIFSLETFHLATAGHPGLATANVAASVVAWLVAAWGGFAAARRLNRPGGI